MKVYTGRFRVYANVVNGQFDPERSCCLELSEADLEICLAHLEIQDVTLTWSTHLEAPTYQARVWLEGVGDIELDTAGSRARIRAARA